MKMFSLLIRIGFCGLFGAWMQRSWAQPINDLCSFATDIQSYINPQGQALVAGPFSNEGATGNDLDIEGVTGCWLDDLTGNADGSSPQVDATVWFRFEGYDGEVMLYVQPCDTNLTFLSQDTQMALYTGECDTLELVACNEDIDAAINNYWSGLTASVSLGNTYYLAVDGFNYSGFGSPELPLTTGEFCLSFVPPAIAVEEIPEGTVEVFPNPTQGVIKVQSSAFILDIIIYDAMGKMCESYSPYQRRSFELDIAAAPGIYTMLVLTEMGSTVHRVIRN